jgi:hypothetical protein
LIGQYGGVKISGTWDWSAHTQFILDAEMIQPVETWAFFIAFCFDTGTAFTNYAYFSGLGFNISHLGRNSYFVLKSALSIVGTPN